MRNNSVKYKLQPKGNLKFYKPEVDYNEKELLKILNLTDIDTKVKKNIEALLDFKKLNIIDKKKVIFKFLSTPFNINIISKSLTRF